MRAGFQTIVDYAFSGLGFPAPAPYQVFPNDMFLPGGDLTPIQTHLDGIVHGLTRWQPKPGQQGRAPAPMINVAGKDYDEALTNLNDLFLKNQWGDGLAILPPTRQRVDWILTATDLPRASVVGKVLPRGGIATVELLAISLAMAGGRPEYLPVLISAMKAILDPLMRHQTMNATTCSCFPAVIVNGPVAKKIRLNSGYGCLGPDPMHPAGGSIGRAIRLIIQNIGDALPGSGTMAIFGTPGKYTNAVFAEDAEALPAGWQPLHVERGFAAGSNVVTVSPVLGAVNVSGGGTASTQEEAVRTLYRLTTMMQNPIPNYFQDNFKEGAAGIVLVTRYAASGLAALGWSKRDVQAFLWEHSKIPWPVVTKALSPKRIDRAIEVTGLKYDEPWPITSRPENIMIVVAGGEQSGHCYWMQGAYTALKPVSAEITLPAAWDKLPMTGD